ncbi:acyltransferase family protein [Coleofasciculus sp. F4-SAH-05]|uniref:acyltransferase family protein n=1 Tax=Coleofasciculus sp. F4-SAH-05 TaxID=3069525 RepID=UPI0032F56542
MKNSNLKRIDLLQVYRGLAAILVLFFHGSVILSQQFNQQEFFFNIGGVGWIGVDFFFVLSGFIIYYVHQNDIGHPNKIKSYILKRFIRVYPLYWTILICKIVALFFINYGNSTYDLSFLSSLKNISLYPQKERLLNVSWTLSCEVFFYIIFGILIVVGYKRFLPLFILWTTGILINSVWFIESFQGIPILNLIFNTINLEFLLGGLIAYIISTQKITFKRGLFFNYLATFLLALFLTMYQSQVIDDGTGIMWAFAFALLILGSAAVEINKTIKIPVFLVYIGNASYSIYLTHGFFVSNIAKVMTKLNSSVVTSPPLVINAVALMIFTLTIGLGCLVYSYIEKPLITLLRAQLLPRKLT